MRTSIRWALRRIGHAAVEAVYPKVCAGCGMRGMWLCDLCEPTVPTLAAVTSCCARCGVPRLGNRCGCREVASVIAHARSAYPYDGWAAASVRRLKYEAEPARAEHLAMLMAHHVAAFGPINAYVPVPLHPSRERERGYNQAERLATALSRITGVPVAPILHRTTVTVSQTTLSARERKANVANVFAIDPTWRPRPGGRYVLIDDVRTTGSTMNACAGVLQALRPASIGVMTFAIDLPADRLEALRALMPASPAWP